MTVKPGRIWYLLSLLLFLFCAVGGTIYLFSAMFHSFPGGTQFIVPGDLTITVEKPGKYILWNETNVIYNGRMYTGSSSLPDSVGIRVYELLTGRTVPLKSSSNARESAGPSVRTAVSDISFDKPGRYRIEVNGDFSERVFMLRRSACSDILHALAVFVPLSILGWIVSPLILLIVFVKRANKIKKLQQSENITLTDSGQQARPTASDVGNSEKTWATFCHLSAFSGYFFPLANIIVPLILWLTKKDEYPLVDDQGKEAINFQISMTLYYIISSILILAFIGVLMLIGLSVFNLIVVIIASVKANKGEKYRYPLCIRFVR